MPLDIYLIILDRYNITMPTISDIFDYVQSLRVTLGQTQEELKIMKDINQSLTKEIQTLNNKIEKSD